MNAKIFFGLIGGAAIGVLASGFVAGVIAGLTAHRLESDARKDLPLTTVTVYAKDLAAGEKATFEAIAQRAIPDVLVTKSMVLPKDASYVVNQLVLAPVLNGDPVHWSDLVSASDSAKFPEALEACNARFASKDRPKSVADFRALLARSKR